MPKNLPIGDKNINSTATANSKATTTGQPGTNGIQGGSGANTDEHNAYRAAIRREIERHKRYPARAKMMRKQGVVSVSFSVGADGSLSGERVTNSSGDESLDNAALEAVRSARPVGPKPAGFASSVSVPISFTIQYRFCYNTRASILNIFFHYSFSNSHFIFHRPLFLFQRIYLLTCRQNKMIFQIQ